MKISDIKLICRDSNIDYKSLIVEEVEYQERAFNEMHDDGGRTRNGRGFEEFEQEMERSEIVIEEDIRRSKQAGQMFTSLYKWEEKEDSLINKEQRDEKNRVKSANEEKSNFVTDYSERRGPRRY